MKLRAPIHCLALLSSLLGAATAAIADDCEALFAPAFAAEDPDAVARLLGASESDERCAWNQREFVRLEATKWVAATADEQASAGRIEAAESLLDGQDPAGLALAAWWRINAVLGEIATARSDWSEAALQFGEAYRLAVEQLDTGEPVAPPHIEQLQLALFDRAAEAMLLSGDVSSAIARSGIGTGILGLRGPKPRAVPLPVRFEFDRSELAAEGRVSAARLAAFVRQRGLASVEIIGHTDPQGGASYNRGLSKRRARTVARTIREAFETVGEMAPNIAVDGRGEDCPAVLSDADRYTVAQRHSLYRRVEVVLDPEVSASRVQCGLAPRQ